MMCLTHQESYIALFLLSLEKRKIQTWCLKSGTAKTPSGGTASDFGWARSCQCAIKLVMSNTHNVSHDLKIMES